MRYYVCSEIRSAVDYSKILPWRRVAFSFALLSDAAQERFQQQPFIGVIKMDIQE
jgi:hypothetical protein